MMREQTLIPGFASRFCFVKIDTREDANIHKTFACKYLSNNICTGVEEWTHGYFRLGYFSSSTLRPRDTVDSEGVAAVCSGFCARSWASWRKLQRSPCEHWPFPFRWKQIPSPSSTPDNPSRFLTTAPVSILPCLASFVIEVSDRSSSSPLSSIFDNWASLSSDECPCRTILKRF